MRIMPCANRILRTQRVIGSKAALTAAHGTHTKDARAFRLTLDLEVLGVSILTPRSLLR